MGGSIESNGDITIEANSADSIKGNIKAVGETISGKTVKLVASNDVSLQAATTLILAPTDQPLLLAFSSFSLVFVAACKDGN